MPVARLLRFHGHEEVEVVPPVDVHVLGDGAKAVRRVLVAAILRIVVERPAGATGDGGVGMSVHGVVAAVVLEAALVVDVRGLAVRDFAEDALLHHVEHKHLLLAVAAVLEHHAGNARTLARLHELPSLVDCQDTGNFVQNHLAMFHRIQRYRGMFVPWRDVVDYVNLVRVADALVALAPRNCNLRRWLVVLLEPLHLPVYAILEEVRDGGHLRAGDHRNAPQRRPAAHAYADTRDSHLLHGLQGEALHRRTRRAEYLQRIACAPCRHRDRAHPRRALQEFSSVLLHFLLLLF